MSDRIHGFDSDDTDLILALVVAVRDFADRRRETLSDAPDIRKSVEKICQGVDEKIKAAVLPLALAETSGEPLIGEL